MTRFITAFLKTLSRKELLVFSSAVILCIISGLFWGTHVLYSITTQIPKDGGSYTEGVVGQIAFINPVLAEEGTADRDLTSLVFANSLTLAESIKSSNSFKTWNLRIKDGAVWSDGTPITSDDFIYTIQTIQNPQTGSPLTQTWQSIAVTRISQREIQFQLASSYATFTNILKDLRPIPKKKFADISPANIKLSAYNLEPLGSGPFMYDSLEKRSDGFVTEYNLVRNENYKTIGTLPHIENFTEEFFENETNLLQAYNTGILDGVGTYNPNIIDNLALNSTVHEVPSLKYYSVFFNENAQRALSSPTIREVLSTTVDKAKIINTVFHGKATAITGPLPSNIFPVPSTSQNGLSRELVEEKLQSDGWIRNSEKNLWEKQDKDGVMTLSFTIKTPNNPLLTGIAEEVKKNWEEVGIQTTIETFDAQSMLNDVIKTRNYQMLLFGNILLKNPDLFHFWYSSERFYPGLNFALYQNPTVDELIKSLKSTGEGDIRTQTLKEISRIISADNPAAFLVSPSFLYITKKNITGIRIDSISLPEDRFEYVTDWFVRTKRIFK